MLCYTDSKGFLSNSKSNLMENGVQIKKKNVCQET